jgi:hypothetical protein
LYFSRSAIEFVNGREKTQEVKVRNHPDIGYACSLKHVIEAWEYDNGDILLLGSFNIFPGTFASQDRIEVLCYGLTKRNISESAQKKRRKKDLTND